VAFRVLKTFRSGYYEWRHRSPSNRAPDDAELTNTILFANRISARDFQAEALARIPTRTPGRRLATDEK